MKMDVLNRYWGRTRCRQAFYPSAPVVLGMLLTMLVSITAPAATPPAMATAPTLATQAAIDTPPVFAAEDSWPPYADSEGNGISRNLITHALALSGIHPQFQVLPYARVLFSIQKGDVIGGFNITRQQTTEAMFMFGQQPLLSAPASFYFRPGEENDYATLQELPSGTRIGLIIDYEYGDRFESQRDRFVEVRVSRQSQLIKMLLKGRVDTIIMFDRVADYTLQQLQQTAPDTDWNIKRGMKNHESQIYVGFSRSAPNAEAMMQALDKGLVTLRKNGDYERILTGELH